MYFWEWLLIVAAALMIMFCIGLFHADGNMARVFGILTGVFLLTAWTMHNLLNIQNQILNGKKLQ